jgi:hypothetical protein
MNPDVDIFAVARDLREQNRKHNIWHGELQAQIARRDGALSAIKSALYRIFDLDGVKGSPEEVEAAIADCMLALGEVELAEMSDAQITAAIEKHS